MKEDNYITHGKLELTMSDFFMFLNKASKTFISISKNNSCLKFNVLIFLE